MSDVLSIKTTTVKYRPKPQAAVQYEIVLLSGTLVYNPNTSDKVKGALQWQVYKIEGDKRTRMPNNVEGMKCYCGYSDNPSSESPSSEAGTNATDNVTFNDNGKAEVDYNSRTTKQFTIVYGSVTDGVFTQLARLGVPVNVAGKDSTPTLSIHLDNQYDTILCYYHGGNAVIYGSKPVTNIKVMYGGEDVTAKLESDVTATANTVNFDGQWQPQNEQYKVNSISSDTTITFSATYKGQTATAAMTVRLQDGGNKYNIRTSVSTIVYNTSTGGLSPEDVNIEVWMENETGSSLLTSIPDGMTLSYTREGEDAVEVTSYYNNGYTMGVSLPAKNTTITLAGSQNVVLDTQTVSVAKVKDGNDAPQLQFLSPSCIVRLSNNTYGTPVVASSNKASFYLGSNIMNDTIFWFAKEDDAHKIIKSDPTNPTNPKTLSFNGWTFDVSNSNGILTFKLVSVDSGAAETISLPIYAESHYATNTAWKAHNNVSYAIARKGENGESATSIDFDNNNATLLYNSSKGVYANSAVANVSLLVGGEDKSNTATITIESHGVNAAVTRGVGETASTTFISDSNKVIPSGTGIISVTATSLKDDNTPSGYITATYTDSSNIKYTATFNVTRSVGRYAVEIIATPTQISYNQTTGIASSSKVVATINAIDINGKKADGAAFSTFGAMKWRYIGATEWTNYAPDPTSGQSASVLEIKNLDFTKSGVEFSFIDGSRNQLDYETVPFSSVSNGGDAYLVNAASMNIALTLSQISYGTPLGDVPNVIYMTKNNVVVVEGIKYKLPEGNETIDASHPSAEVTYNRWVFDYVFSEGKLNITLKEVRKGQDTPTSMQLPIEVIYGTGTDSITRIIYVSYTAIQKGPAGRSYKPNTPVLFEEGKEYKWDDEYRDFIYYAFKVNDKGEQDDEKGALSYFMYGVKEYGMTKVKTPPSLKGGDDNWEYVSEYKSIIVNCLFGTNAIIGGFRMSGGVQESVCTSEDERIVYDENGNEIIENGKVVTEKYQKPLIIIDGNEGVIEIFKKKAGMRIGLDGEGNPCIMGYNTDGKCVWKLGTEVVTNPTDNVNIQIPSGSTTASAFVNGNTLTISVRGKWLVTNNTNNPIRLTKELLKGTFENPLSGDLSVPGDISIGGGETREIIFSGSKFNTYDEGYLPPFDHFRIKVTAIYGTEAKAQSYVVARVLKPNDPIIH